MTEKKMASLLTAYQNPEGPESIIGQRPVSISAFGPRAKSGCGLLPAKSVWLPLWQAKRSACPTRGWVKSASPVMRVTASQVHSALGGQYFGVILL